MVSTEVLVVIVAAVVVVGLLWYYRDRIPGLRPSADVEAERERQSAAAAAEEARLEAMVMRYCPHCGVEREVRNGQCVECGYRFT